MTKLEILQLLDELFSKNQVHCGHHSETGSEYAISNSISNDIEDLIRIEENKIEEKNDMRKRGLI